MQQDDATGNYAQRLFYWWADRPLLQSLLFVTATMLAGIGYYDPSLILASGVSDDAEQSPLDALTRDPAEPLPDVEPFEVASGQCIVVATSDDFFTTENLVAIRAVVAALETLPQVRSVLWVESIPGLNLFGLPASPLPRSDASPRVLKLARQRTLENPLAAGQLISEDGGTLLLNISIDWFYVTSDEAITTDLRRAAEQAAADVPGAEIAFSVTGEAPLALMMMQNHARDTWRYQLIGYGFMTGAAVVLFRGAAAVLIVIVAPAVGVFWTMGALHYFDLQHNPFSDVIVPVLVSLVGLTDAVHLMVEIRNRRATGLDVQQATRRGVARVGMACVLTSITTAVGFASLAWAHHEIVQEFGRSCVLGVACTLASVLTVIPLGCRSPLGRKLHVGLGNSLIDRQLRRIGPIVDWVLLHDRAMAWTAIVATVLLAAASLQLNPDERRYSGLSDTGEAAQALRHLDRALGGLEFAHVQIDWQEDAEESELLSVLDEVHQVLASETLIGRSLGLRELLAALPGEGEPSERMSLLELLPAELKRAFYTPEVRRARVQFRVQDIGIARYGPVFETIESRLSELASQYPHFAFELEGSAIWRWRNVYRIVTDLAASLGTASVVIWIILTIVYRSVRIGLISVVPNVFPLAAVGATLWLAGQYLELVTVCVFTICIGIAVDDTIHFLTRYREEQAYGGSHREVIRRAFTGVGSALLMTTIVLVTGMLTTQFGDARDARLFGLMGALTLAAALFADIVFLPALLSRFGKRSPSGARQRVPSEIVDAGFVEL